MRPFSLEAVKQSLIIPLTSRTFEARIECAFHEHVMSRVLNRFAGTGGDLHHCGSPDRLLHRGNWLLAIRQLLVAGARRRGHSRIA